MMIYVIYLIMGVLVGLLIKFEVEARLRNKKVRRKFNRINDLSDKTLRQYDEILYSIRSLNESINNKKEVR